MLTVKRLDEIYKECRYYGGIVHSVSTREIYDLVSEVINRRKIAQKICAGMSGFRGACINETLNDVNEIPDECRDSCAKHDCKKCWEVFLSGDYKDGE